MNNRSRLLRFSGFRLRLRRTRCGIRFGRLRMLRARDALIVRTECEEWRP